MEKMSLEGQGLREFIGDFRVMHCLFCDKSKEQISKGTDFMKDMFGYLKANTKRKPCCVPQHQKIDERSFDHIFYEDRKSVVEDMVGR